MTELASLIDKLAELGLQVATAESCTGGLLAAALTSVPGASDVFACGVVSYSNESKIRLLGVEAATLASHGAVSGETALAMARGMRERGGADLAISITGIAGPGGGSAEKPVGLVYIGLADGSAARAKENRFAGSREEIRRQAAEAALAILDEYLASR